ncbi:MAG: hypothetical protein PHH14_03815 [Candidatus Margulisbacteria bacterium]|nr:hypothetical protein [Candidatus Margulisiibacteriota bacterium]
MGIRTVSVAAKIKLLAQTVKLKKETFSAAIKRTRILHNLGVTESNIDWMINKLVPKRGTEALLLDNSGFIKALGEEGLKRRLGEEFSRTDRQNLEAREPRIIMPGDEIELRDSDKIPAIKDITFSYPRNLALFNRKHITDIIKFILETKESFALQSISCFNDYCQTKQTSDNKAELMIRLNGNRKENHFNNFRIEVFYFNSEISEKCTIAKGTIALGV